MGLRERVAHLERWYDEQEKINHLTEEVFKLRKELDVVEDFLGIRITLGPHVTKTKGE